MSNFQQAFLWMTDQPLTVGSTVTTTTKGGVVRQQTVEQCFPYNGKYGSIVRPIPTDPAAADKGKGKGKGPAAPAAAAAAATAAAHGAAAPDVSAVVAAVLAALAAGK